MHRKRVSLSFHSGMSPASKIGGEIKGALHSFSFECRKRTNLSSQSNSDVHYGIVHGQSQNC